MQKNESVFVLSGCAESAEYIQPMHGVLFIGQKGASHCSVTYSVRTYIHRFSYK